MKRPNDSNFLGVMNAYVGMTAIYNKQRVAYNGTTVDLVKMLVKAGAKPGDLFVDEQGRTRKVLNAPHDTRTGGYWVTQFNKKA